MAGPSRLSMLLAGYRIQRRSLASDMDVSLQTIHNWCSTRVPVPIHQIDRLIERLRRAGAEDSEIAELVASQLEAHGLSSGLVEAFRAQTAVPKGLGSVMLIAWDLKSGGMFPHFAHSCRESVEALGYTCLVVDCGGVHSMKQTYVREAVRRRYAGVLLVGVPGAFPDPDDDLFATIESLDKSGIPTVMVTPWRAHLNLPAGVAGIGWDADAANEKALDTLFQLGHRDVAVLLSGPGTLSAGRHQGVDRAFEALGREMREDLVVWVDGDDDDLPETSRVIRSASAVYARASTLATLANACYTQGLRWPQDLSILTIAHAQALVHLGTNPFSYVSVPVRRISQGAAQLLSSLSTEDRGPYSQQFIVYGSSSMRVINQEGGSIGAPAAGRIAASPPLSTTA